MQYLVFYCASIHPLQNVYIFWRAQLDALLRKTLKLNYLFLSHIIEAAFVIVLLLISSSVPIMHIFCPKYDLSDSFIPSSLSLPFQGEVVHLYIIDLVQPNVSPTLSFSGIYQKSFIYCRNVTNSQKKTRVYLPIWSLWLYTSL